LTLQPRVMIPIFFCTSVASSFNNIIYIILSPWRAKVNISSVNILGF